MASLQQYPVKYANEMRVDSSFRINKDKNKKHEGTCSKYKRIVVVNKMLRKICDQVEPAAKNVQCRLTKFRWLMEQHKGAGLHMQFYDSRYRHLDAYNFDYYLM